MRSTFALPAAILATLAIAGGSIPASASAAAVTYQLTVTESTATMTYGESEPTFRVYLTVPSDDPPLGGVMPLYIMVDSQAIPGTLTDHYPDYVLYVAGIAQTPLSVGQHTVVAKYQSPNHGLLSSAPIFFNVVKSTPTLRCSIVNWANTYAPNTRLTLLLDFSGTNAPVDIQNGSFSITFTGPRTFAHANLIANSARQVAVSAPSATGVYQFRCAFSGTPSFNSVEGPPTSGAVIVSANNPVGGIALYTNPTPVTHGPMITWQIVISAGSGLPTPTGNVGLYIGRSYTRLIALGSGGSVSFDAIAPSGELLDTIRVGYTGDPVYAASSANFSPNTPPIPAPALPGVGAATAMPTPESTPTPDASDTPTAAPQAIALASPTKRFDAALASSAGHSSPGGFGTPYVVGALATVTLLGVGAGLALRHRRRRRPNSSPTT